MLNRKLRGHYNYYGVTGNAQALSNFRRMVKRLWRKWLSRRSRETTCPTSHPRRKRATWKMMSYEDYFVRIFEIHPEALPFLRYMSFRKR